jgi:tartrate dehydrogenase/decarboxylase/D-malate dehydrogenase
MQETVMSRVGVDRVLKFAFELAQSRPKKHLTSATKSNGIASPCRTGTSAWPRWPKSYPRVKLDKFHIDILTAHFVQRPDFFDVVVASNLFGDILSDLGPACTGTIGIAPSANLNPDRKFPRCSSRCTARRPTSTARNIANPIGQIWCGAMMLEFLGHKEAHDAILQAIEKVLDPKSARPRTRDIGGKASTTDVGRRSPPRCNDCARQRNARAARNRSRRCLQR